MSASFYIGQSHFLVDAHEMTGRAIRDTPLPSIADDKDLWLVGRGSEEDRLVRDEEVIDVRGARFYTAPRIINAGDAQHSSYMALLGEMRAWQRRAERVEAERDRLRAAIERELFIDPNASEAERRRHRLRTADLAAALSNPTATTEKPETCGALDPTRLYICTYVNGHSGRHQWDRKKR